MSVITDDIRKDYGFFREIDAAIAEGDIGPEAVAYLDNAATTQRPDRVLEAVNTFYKTVNSNPLRGLYRISMEATEQYENARAKVAEFINASRPEEIIFTKNASESLNLAAFSLCEKVLKPGDEIVVGIMEHHSNMLPWRVAAARHGATVKYLEPDTDKKTDSCAGGEGLVTPEKLESVLTDKTKIVAVTHVSNVLGRKNDIKEFARICHERDIVIVCDGSQSVPHEKVDVRELDVDFLAFSGHKMGAPMGIGVLYGKYGWLEKLPPFLMGGEMIEIVTLDRITYAEIPHRFEAGTVNAGGAIGLSAAIDYYTELGMDNIVRRENELTEYAFRKLSEIDGISIIGSEDPDEHHGILTFVLADVHPHDIAYILDEQAHVAIRAGHHCAQPLLRFLGTPSTARASIAFYNTKSEIDRMAACLAGMRRQLGFD
ncbi:MAG: cysteine desulfurase [Eubacterium sp.]|nr:cysteine desulfurase [Eubacterium sp.]